LEVFLGQQPLKTTGRAVPQASVPTSTPGGAPRHRPA
jgi:hypothetical protein